MVVLGAATVLLWDWGTDYLRYRKDVASITPPGQETTFSLEEFSQYRKAAAFYDTARRLERMKAPAEVVRDVLGEPDQVGNLDDHDSWFYPGPILRERQQPTIILRIDHETQRVSGLSFIVHN
jgi:hypothetical protein